MDRDPLTARAVLAKWLRAKNLDSDLLPYVIARRWPALVGERIAGRTRPLALRDGELTVEVASSAWLNELTFLRGRLLGSINAGLHDRAGDANIAERPARRPTTVQSIRLVVGRPPAIDRQGPARAAQKAGGQSLLEARSMELPFDLQAELSKLNDPALEKAIRRAWSLAQLFEAEIGKRTEE